MNIRDQYLNFVRNTEAGLVANGAAAGALLGVPTGAVAGTLTALMFGGGLAAAGMFLPFATVGGAVFLAVAMGLEGRELFKQGKTWSDVLKPPLGSPEPSDTFQA